VTTDTWFERLRENSWCSCFLPPFSWAIARSFQFPERFLATVTTVTCLDGCHQNSHFSCFLPFFVGYSTQFSVPGQFLAILTTDTWFKWRRQTSYFSYFLPIFMGYRSHFSVSKTIYSDRDHRYMVWEASLEFVLFIFLSLFSWAIVHNFSFFGRFPATLTTYTWLDGSLWNRPFHVFWSFLWAIAHSFWFPGSFPAIVTTNTLFEGHHQNSHFSRFLPIVLGYIT
jgi:hypothetical protein